MRRIDWGLIGGLLVVGSYIALVLGLIVGWIMNIVALTSVEPWAWTTNTLLGVIGIFVPPLGSIMGLFIW